MTIAEIKNTLADMRSMPQNTRDFPIRILRFGYQE